VLELADKYEAYQDNPWPLLYKELDRRYPKSKFILTIRDESKWIKSAVNHFGSSHTDMRKWIYGIGHPKGNEEIYLERYRKHNEEVLQYFKDRKDDLLIIEWAKGDEWQKLCDFIDEPVPEAAFPHANKGNYSGNRKTSISYYKTLIKKTIKRIFK